MMTNIEDKIKALESDPKTWIQFIRNPIKQKSDNWHESAHEWLIHFPGGTTQKYYTGIGHRVFQPLRGMDQKEWENLRHKNLTDTGFEKVLNASKPTPPSVKDVLYSLTMDSSAADTNFSDWCDGLGYDDDSMKAMEIYKECVKAAGFLRGLGFNLDELREFFQEY
jgi:hypothetical protein